MPEDKVSVQSSKSRIAASFSALPYSTPECKLAFVEKTIDEALQQAMTAQGEGYLQEAEQLYLGILKVQPGHAEANHNMGLLAPRLGRPLEEVPLLKLALDTNSKEERYWLSYLDALIRAKYLSQAHQVIEQAKRANIATDKLKAFNERLQKLSSKSDKKRKQGPLLSEKRKRQAKKKKNARISAANAMPTQYHLNRLLEVYQNGKARDAEALAISFTLEFPASQLGWKVLGAIFSQTGRLSESLAPMQKSVELAPLDAQAHNNLGVTLEQLGRLGDATVAYEQAIHLKGDFVEARYNLGNVLKKIGRLNEAENSYRQVIAIQADHTNAHFNLGATLKDLGKLPEAEESYRKALACKPDDADTQNNLGIILQQLGRPDKALEFFLEAIALKPAFAEAHNNLGKTLQALGRLEEAQASFGQAIALRSGYSEALANRSILLFEQKEFESALRDADSCNTDLSKYMGLAALYALKRIDEVFERIDRESLLDPNNIRTAAFAAFVSAIEARDTTNNFCSDPMSFLYFSKLSRHLENDSKFSAELIAELRNYQTVWEPSGRSTIKGLQTVKNVNLLEQQSAHIVELRSIILAEVESYFSQFKDEACVFIKEWPMEKSLLGWHVILKQQGHQSPHIHPTGWLSGVIYLQVVPCLDKNEGAIEFSLNGMYHFDDRAPTVVHQPAQGDIILFPSSLYHRTIPFTADTDRITISFDLKPKTRPATG